MAALTSGPAMAIHASRPGVSGSRPSWDTPPRMNRVMLRTGIPCERATSEWPNSCASTETNNRSAAMSATDQVETGLQAGYTRGKKPVASVYAKNAITMNQLGWTATSMPNRRPILMPRMVSSDTVVPCELFHASNHMERGQR